MVGRWGACALWRVTATEGSVVVLPSRVHFRPLGLYRVRATIPPPELNIPGESAISIVREYSAFDCIKCVCQKVPGCMSERYTH